MHSCVGILDKAMTHILGGTEWVGTRFHHAAQNGTQLCFWNFPGNIFEMLLATGN